MVASPNWGPSLGRQIVRHLDKKDLKRGPNLENYPRALERIGLRKEDCSHPQPSCSFFRHRKGTSVYHQKTAKLDFFRLLNSVSQTVQVPK